MKRFVCFIFTLSLCLLFSKISFAGFKRVENVTNSCDVQQHECCGWDPTGFDLCSYDCNGNRQGNCEALSCVGEYKEGDVIECDCVENPEVCMDRNDNDCNGYDNNGNGITDDGGNCDDNNPPPKPDDCYGGSGGSIRWAYGNAIIRPEVDFEVRLWGDESFRFLRGYNQRGWYNSIPVLMVELNEKFWRSRVVFINEDGRRIPFYPKDGFFNNNDNNNDMSYWIRNFYSNYEFENLYTLTYISNTTNDLITGNGYQNCNGEIEFIVENKETGYEYNFKLTNDYERGISGDCGEGRYYPQLTEIRDKNGRRVLKQEYIGYHTGIVWYHISIGDEYVGNVKHLCISRNEMSGSDSGSITIYGVYNEDVCSDNSKRLSKKLIEYKSSSTLKNHWWSDSYTEWGSEDGSIINEVLYYGENNNVIYKKKFEYATVNVKYDSIIKGEERLSKIILGDNITQEEIWYYSCDSQSNENDCKWSGRVKGVRSANEYLNEITYLEDENTKNKTTSYNLHFGLGLVAGGSVGSNGNGVTIGMTLGCPSCGGNRLNSAGWSGLKVTKREYKNGLVREFYYLENDFNYSKPWAIEEYEKGMGESSDFIRKQYEYLSSNKNIYFVEKILKKVGGDDLMVRVEIRDYIGNVNGNYPCLGDTQSLKDVSVSLEDKVGSCNGYGVSGSLLKRVILQDYNPITGKYRTRVREISYNDNGLKSMETGFSGEKTIYEYNNGLLSKIKRCLDSSCTSYFTTTYKEYDMFGNPIKVIEEDGRQVEYKYDLWGRVIWQRETSSDNKEVREKSYFYSITGLIEREIDYGGKSSTSYVYDNYGRVLEKRRDIKVLGIWFTTNKERYEYDDSGRMIRKEYVLDDNDVRKVESYEYNAGGEIEKVVNHNTGKSKIYSYSYFEENNCPGYGEVSPIKVGKVVSVRNEDGTEDVSCYSVHNDLIRFVRKDSNGTILSIASYEYYMPGMMSKFTDAGGVDTTYTYNGAGNLLRVESPDGGVIEYDYDASGRVIRKKVNNNVMEEYNYDLLGRLYEVKAGEEKVNYNYDGLFLRMVEDSSGSTYFSYDGFGRLKVESRKFSDNKDYALNTTYEYDNRDNLVSITYPSPFGEHKYIMEYGSLPNFIMSIKDGNGKSLVDELNYEPWGEIRGYKYGNGIETGIYRYAGGAVSKIEVKKGSDYILNKEYGLYDDGNIKEIKGTESVILDNGSTQAKNVGMYYEYDGEDRLSLAQKRSYTDSGFGVEWGHGFKYSSAGNRVEHYFNSKKETYSYYNGTNRLVHIADPVNEDSSIFDKSVWNMRGGMNGEFISLLEECRKAGKERPTSIIPSIMQCEDKVSDKFREFIKKYRVDDDIFKKIVINSPEVNGLAVKMLQSKLSYYDGKMRSLFDEANFDRYIDSLKGIDIENETKENEIVKYGLASNTGYNTKYLYDGMGNVYGEVIISEDSSKSYGVICYRHNNVGQLIEIYTESWSWDEIRSRWNGIENSTICKNVEESRKGVLVKNGYDYKGRRVYEKDVTILVPKPNKYFIYDANDNLISEIFYGADYDDTSKMEYKVLREYVWLYDMPVAQVVYGDTELYTEGGCSGGGGGCSIIDNEKERIDRIRLVLIITLGGIGIIGVLTGRGRRYSIIVVIMMMALIMIAPYKAKAFSRGVVFYYHNDHLNTPVKMTDEKGNVVWEVVDKHPFGEFEVKGKTVNLSDYGGVESWSYTVENPLRFPGQYNDYNYRSVVISGKKGPYYNYHRWYNPDIGRYMEVDDRFLNLSKNSGVYKTEVIYSDDYQVIIKLTLNDMYINMFSYSYNNPVAIVDRNGDVGVIGWGLGIIGGYYIVKKILKCYDTYECLIKNCKAKCDKAHESIETKRDCDLCRAYCAQVPLTPIP